MYIGFIRICTLGVFVLFSLRSNYPILTAQDIESQQDTIQRSEAKTLENTQIVTADDFMQQVADRYGEMVSFVSQLVIIQNGVEEYGEVYAKPPDKFHIAYVEPAEQVINSDGNDFHMFLPDENIVLHQKRNLSTASPSSFLTRSGLDILMKNYSISYVENPDYSQLDNEPGSRSSRSGQLLVKGIRMRRKSPSQSFREIILYVGKDYLIHRVKAITFNKSRVQFDFINIRTDELIPDNKFKYDPPPTAPVIDDFFYETGDTQ